MDSNCQQYMPSHWNIMNGNTETTRVLLYKRIAAVLNSYSAVWLLGKYSLGPPRLTIDMCICVTLFLLINYSGLEYKNHNGFTMIFILSFPSGIFTMLRRKQPTMTIDRRTLNSARYRMEAGAMPVVDLQARLL